MRPTSLVTVHRDHRALRWGLQTQEDSEVGRKRQQASVVHQAHEHRNSRLILLEHHRGVGYTLFNVEKNNTGLRGSLSVGTVGMMSILGVGINGLSFSLYWFIADTTLKKIRKWQGKQVAVAPGQDETVVSSVSQARRNSNFNSSSSPSTMARSSVE